MTSELNEYYTTNPSKAIKLKYFADELRYLCVLCEKEIKDIKIALPACNHIKFECCLENNFSSLFCTKQFGYWKNNSSQKNNDISDDELRQFYMYIVQKIIEYKNILNICNMILNTNDQHQLNIKSIVPFVPSDDSIDICRKRHRDDTYDGHHC
jgi:hypothetical protein